MNPKRPSPRHSIVKMAKVKKRILMAVRGKKKLITREPT